MELIGTFDKSSAIAYESYLGCKQFQFSLLKRIEAWIHEALQNALTDSDLESSSPFPRYGHSFYISFART